MKIRIFLISILFIFPLSSCTKKEDTSTAGGSEQNASTPPPASPTLPAPAPVPPATPPFSQPTSPNTPSVTTECNDGIDNDGDGLWDYELDLGCTHPEDTNEGGLASGLKNEMGWSEFKKNSNTKIIYVSQSEGEDHFSGLLPYKNQQQTDGPKKSIKAALPLLRPNQGDWILFKRGDVWAEDLSSVKWDFSGASKEDKKIFGSYGKSQKKPEIQMIHNKGALFSIQDTNPKLRYQGHIAFLGLHFTAPQRNPNIPGNSYESIKEAHIHPDTGSYQAPQAFVWRASKDNYDLLMEGCEFSYFGKYVIQWTHNQPKSSLLNDFTFRRNLVHYNYGFSMDTFYSISQVTALYTNGIRNLLIEENIFDHNGWLAPFIETGKNHYSKAIYIGNSNLKSNVRKNIISQTAQFGIYTQSTTLIENNLFIKNTTSIHVHALHSQVIGNTFIDGQHVEYGNGMGLKGIGIQLNKGASHTLISNNQFLAKDNCGATNPPDENNQCTGSAHAIELHPDVINIELSKNILIDWNSSTLGMIRFHSTNTPLIFTENKILNLSYLSSLVTFTSSTVLPEKSVFKGNQYFSHKSESEWFYLKNKWVSLKEWAAFTHEDAWDWNGDADRIKKLQMKVKSFFQNNSDMDSDLSIPFLESMALWIQDQKTVLPQYQSIENAFIQKESAIKNIQSELSEVE